MDQQLRNAIINKDDSAYRFMSEAFESKPMEYFKSVHLRTSRKEGGGNIFHLAAYHNNVSFFEAALTTLPKDVVHSLLCQQKETRCRTMNPIHLAARRRCDLIVRLLIKFYSRGRDIDGATRVDLEPWLAQDESYKSMPLHYVLDHGSQNQALQILSLVGVDKVSNIEDDAGDSPLCLAVKRGFSRVADHILCSTLPYSLRGRYHTTALFYAPNCSDDVLNRLLHQHSELIVGVGGFSGGTVLHQWAVIGSIYAFKQVIEGDFIPPYLRKAFMDQLSSLNNYGENPLHVVARSGYDKVRTVEVAKILVESYKLDRPEALSMPQKAMSPWFKMNNHKKTPLGVAIENQNEPLALYFLSLDSVYFVAENHEDHLLYLAIQNGCPQVAKEILDIVDQFNLNQLLTLEDGLTVLHVAPECTEAILRRVLENYPELMEESSRNGETVLHSWIRIGKLWPFEYILNKDRVSDECRRCFIYLLERENVEGRKPLHLAAASCNNADDEGVIEQVVHLLLDAWDESVPGPYLQWSGKDSDGNTPLSTAISKRSEKLTLCFLSRGLLHFNQLKNGEVGDIIINAVEYGWQQVVRYILDQVPLCQHCNVDCLRSSGKNALHVGWKSTEEYCRLMIEKWPELINQRDDDGKTPLERASEAGATWLVELILQMDRSSIINSPTAWVEACKNGHLSTVLAFAEKSPYFRNLCRENGDTPLHHLQDVSYKEYQKLLEDPSIKKLRNIQNSKGETPLHRAIRSENKNLTEILLTMDDVDRTIKDNDSKTAMHLLKELCDKNLEWRRMCEVIGVDPKLKTTYIQLKTNLAEMRSIISLVAALLATITFQAGLTVPGGFDNDNGDAILVTKATFMVFLITDAYAMCCSMLILFCIVWSMVCDRNRSSLLIDRSLVLLKQSLYGTLLAFMTGVYTVIHHKCLWAAIAIIVMCCVVVISANRSILYKMLPKLIPAAEDEHRLVQLLKCWKWKHNSDEFRRQRTPLNIRNAAQQASLHV